MVNRVPAKTNWQCLFPRSVGHFGSILVCRTLPANGEPRVWLVLPRACAEQWGRGGYPAGSEKPVAEKSPTLERKYQHHGELLWELLLRQRRWDRLPANLTLKEDRASLYDCLTVVQARRDTSPQNKHSGVIYSPLCCSKPLLYHFFFDMET